MNDEEPVIVTEQAFVPEGEGVIIANVTLYARDLDTPTDDLLFEVPLLLLLVYSDLSFLMEMVFFFFALDTK